MGVPHGEGIVEFMCNKAISDTNMPNLSLPHQIKKTFKGTLNNGRFVTGYLQFYDDSVFIGEFKLTNKFHGMGKMTYQHGVYYLGSWTNG
jgi:hypothetical protein